MTCVYAQARGVWGLRFFTLEAPQKVPLRYLYRGGLEQTGADSSLTALQREREREREGERGRGREREGEREEHKAHKTMVNCF